MKPTGLLAALAALLAVATTAQADPIYSHWCEDLGISCITGFNIPAEYYPLLSTLPQLDPHSYLPAPMADLVVQAQAARDAGDTRALRALYESQASLRGLANHLVFLTGAQVAAGGLNRGPGARMVIDCLGSHVQLRADLPRARQLALLRRIFDQLYSSRLGELVNSVQQELHGPAAYTCELGGSRPSRLQLSQYELQRYGGVSMDIDRTGHSIPLEYISEPCRRVQATQPWLRPGTVATPVIALGTVGNKPRTKPPYSAAAHDDPGFGLGDKDPVFSAQGGQGYEQGWAPNASSTPTNGANDEAERSPGGPDEEQVRQIIEHKNHCADQPQSSDCAPPSSVSQDPGFKPELGQGKGGLDLSTQPTDANGNYLVGVPGAGAPDPGAQNPAAQNGSASGVPLPGGPSAAAGASGASGSSGAATETSASPSRSRFIIPSVVGDYIIRLAADRAVRSSANAGLVLDWCVRHQPVCDYIYNVRVSPRSLTDQLASP